MRSLCDVADPPWLRLGWVASIAFLVIGCVGIVWWQTQSWGDPFGVDRTYERTLGFGLRQREIQNFFYFYYYTGKFPISTGRRKTLRWNEADAWRALEHRESHDIMKPAPGKRWKLPRLIMEAKGILKTGDFGRLFLLYPDAWITGTPKRATILWFNRLLGISSLLAVFVAFGLLDHRLFGTVLVLVLGSNPFEIVELYYKNNIFGHPIGIASLMLALHAPLIVGRPKGRWVYALPIVSGVFLASFRETRLEPALIIASVAATYLFVSGGWRRRAVLVALLAVSAGTTSVLWPRYWEAKFHEAHAIVQRQGGTTFDGAWNVHHAFWHSIWWGLGDFGRSKGYWNDDRFAYSYGLYHVNKRFGTNYKFSGGYHLDSYYTPARKHRIKLETLPEYAIVMRDKVLGDIVDDPVWYTGVIARRLGRLFSRTTPIRLALGTHYVDVPFSGWLFLPALAWLAWMRRWDQMKLLAFYLPTSLSTILVFSGGGMGYNSAFHLALFSVMVCWLVHAATAARTRTIPG
jgi:hypothetical protein